MDEVLENVVPQASNLDNEENLIVSDRVKAPMGGAGSTDFGGSQKHNVARQAGAIGVDHLTLTAAQKTSEASLVGLGGGEGSGGMPLNENPMERSRPGPLLLKQWAKIAAIEEKEGSAIRKLTKHMQAMHDLAKNATNIHKKLKEDLAIAMSELKKLTRAKEESGAEKVAFRETLDRTLGQVVRRRKPPNHEETSF